MSTRNFKYETGFTLVELMITVGILAVISAIAIPAYTGYIQTANRTECYNEVAAIRLAQEEFYLENGSFFTGDSAATLDNNSGGTYDASTNAANCTYAATTTPTSYTITATGNGAELPSETIVTFTK